MSTVGELLIVMGMAPDKASIQQARAYVEQQVDAIAKRVAAMGGVEGFDAKLLKKNLTSSIVKPLEDSAGALQGNLQMLGKLNAVAQGVMQFVGVVQSVASTFVGMVEDAAEYGVKITKLSTQLGLSKEQVQEWGFVAKMAGSDMAAFGRGIQMLERNLFALQHGGNNKLFAAALAEIGISGKQAADDLRKPDGLNDTLFKIADKFKALKDAGKDVELAQIAQKLFGARASEMAADLVVGGAALKEMIDDAKKLGVVLSNEQVTNLKKLSNNINTIKAGLQGMINGAVADAAPQINEALRSVITWLEAHKADIQAFLTFLIGKALELARYIGAYVGKVIGWLLEHREAVEMFITAAVNYVKALIRLWGPFIYQFLTAVLALMVLLAVSLDSLTQVINGLVDGIEDIVADIADSANSMAEFFESAWERIKKAFRDGVAYAADLIEQMPGGSWLVEHMGLGTAGGGSQGVGMGLSGRKPGMNASTLIEGAGATNLLRDPRYLMNATSQDLKDKAAVNVTVGPTTIHVHGANGPDMMRDLNRQMKEIHTNAARHAYAAANRK